MICDKTARPAGNRSEAGAKLHFRVGCSVGLAVPRPLLAIKNIVPRLVGQLMGSCRSRKKVKVWKWIINKIVCDFQDSRNSWQECCIPWFWLIISVRILLKFISCYFLNLKYSLLADVMNKEKKKNIAIKCKFIYQNIWISNQFLDSMKALSLNSIVLRYFRKVRAFTEQLFYKDFSL